MSPRQDSSKALSRGIFGIPGRQLFQRLLALQRSSKFRPTHFDPNTCTTTYYRTRAPTELYPPHIAPYQHSDYDPPNDPSTQLYRRGRMESPGPGGCVALRSSPAPRFVPGSAQPYLKSHARLYANHYWRLAPESETSDYWINYFLWYFIIGGAATWAAPPLYNWCNPEMQGFGC